MLHSRSDAVFPEFFKNPVTKSPAHLSNTGTNIFHPQNQIIMSTRLSYETAPKGFLDGMLKTGQFLRNCGLDARLMALIAHRVSQINGCAFCLDMHHKDAIHMGDTEQRLHSLPAWRECPYYSEAERAALAYAETLTAGHVNDDLIEALAPHFSDADIANLTLAIVSVNAWNRLNKAMQPVPGNYQVNAYA
jgi:AhpD family alkylhydroperoxidase